jgi:predicted Rossmann fold nucleotide-binding protein DprA/Smf involved in DNA uptake
MKIGIVGSRLFDNYDFVKQSILDALDVIDMRNIDTVVSGGAKGVDTLGEQFADEFNLKKLIFRPDWKKDGKGAAMLRNTDIVNNSDILFAFPIKESGGTWNTITKAKRKGVKVYVWEVRPTKDISK